MFKESIFNNVVMLDNKVNIYNAGSKAYIEVNNESDIKSFLELINSDENLQKEEIDFLNILSSNGFIVQEEVDELKLINYIFKKEYFSTTYQSIILVPTLKCNFNCEYCFEKGYNEIEENKRYFEILKEYSKTSFKNLQNVNINLFGGEPLLCKDSIFNYLEYVKQLSQENNFRLNTSIVTNGSLLTEKVVDNLIKYNCVSLQITLDGDKDLHNQTRKFSNGKGSFDILIDKLEMVVRKTKNIKDFRIILRINLNNITVERISNALNVINKEYRSNLNILFRSIYNTKKFKQCNNNDNSKLKAFYEMAINLGFNILKDTNYYVTCEACNDANMFYLMPNLTVWKCINDHGEIKFNGENLAFWYDSVECFNDDQCKKCPLLPDCFGGCILYKSKFNKRKCKNFEMTSLAYKYSR